MPKTLQLSVVTPERVVQTQEDVEQVTVTTEMGEVSILPGHMDLVAQLKPGRALIRRKGGEEILALSTGLMSVVEGTLVTILADTADRAEELDQEAIDRAKADATRVMQEKRLVDDEAFARAAAALERELAKERVLKNRPYKDPIKRR
ncbi:ATP synthase F1 subunit epsilon [Candidatus Uhrbacteria bacterium RIFCSPLOWO2_01_FULL_53_9]|uniref:ATP synthase epsilon chain n=3 Tax=Candidatus Uhriibacteriota TaxID=1752732 RepID=A0A1F7UYM9_9BACT|nr:MAG: ATP synthase F1 subunit epsilon [Candidatus Uhrbacteria bacterium RIFCSPHIGHO2_02_FULL_53_13]OGL83371.1 MAG: ATP synthase F1 subunit epsilon [Candidatus Uhrbacteria bacterium RIFCSPLOWO2_01_FULL_53_9]OGL89152.1 MAG: ATP synthase F1 subunit epsilon [Candidatus Uhrbacteria bacterium RIFCSPLOWO2_02_FULL_53_10]